MLEQYLARERMVNDTYWGKYQYHEGLAVKYGGRRLDALVSSNGASIEPPLSSEWTGDVPFKAADSNLWAAVWPIYSALTNDIHFFPDLSEEYEKRYYRNPISEWMQATENPIWGYDIVGSPPDYDWQEDYVPGRGYDLGQALTKMPIPFTMEDVLSYDTGWEYNPEPTPTNDLWTVAGPLGNFRLGAYDGYPYGENYIWDNWYSGDRYDEYYVEIIRDFYGYWCLYVYPPYGGEMLYWRQVQSPEDADNLDFGDFSAARTTLYDDADDYTHWTNGTTRLDWKRLGIICQLERQMETTYDLYYCDELPLWHMGTEHFRTYRSPAIEIELPEAEYNGQELEPIRNLLNGISWSLDNDDYHSSTNVLGWSTPTCRTPVPTMGDGASFFSVEGSPICIDEEKATELLEFMVSEVEKYTTNRLVRVGFYGHWLAGSGMNLEYMASYSEGVEIVEMPSNTVNVSSSDGFEDSSWRDYPIEQEAWTYGGDTPGGRSHFEFDASRTPGEVALSYDTSTLTSSTSLRYRKDNAFSPSGSLTMPSMTFEAVGGGPVTNWMWQTHGLVSLPTSDCRRTIYPDRVSWEFEAQGVSIEYRFGGFYEFSGSDSSYRVYHSELGKLPSSWSSPSISASWTTSTYGVETKNTDYGELGTFPVRAFYNSTNTTREAGASIWKHTSPTFTWAASETQDATINKFDPSYAALDWGKVYSLRRSELELLLSAEGSGYANDTEPSSGDWDSDNNGFNWRDIKAPGKQGQREFRYRQGETTYNLQRANWVRYDMLASLSAKCKDKCAGRGGMLIGAIERIGRVTQDDWGRLQSSLNKATVSGVFQITGSAPDNLETGEYNGMWIGGEYIDGEWVVTELGQRQSTPVYPYLIGSCGWNLSITYTHPGYANSYRNVRADGFQNPMCKTIWKFKNLRDPQLR